MSAGNRASQDEVPGADQGLAGGAIASLRRECERVDKITVANSLIDELEAKLSSIDSLGALIAAAHLDAAIDALCREFDVVRDISEPASAARDAPAC